MAAVTPDPLTAPTLKYKNMQREMTDTEKAIAEMITANIISTQKEVLTADEAAKYMGIKKSYLYKLTMRRQISYFRPMGKMCYFNRKDIEQWLQTNRVATDDELRQQANAYCMKKGGKHGN